MNHSSTRHPLQRPLAREISRICSANAAGLAMVLSCGTTMAVAGPKDGVVTAGQATIRQGGSTTTIDQASQRAAINWNSFNVGASETVNFRQPNASAVILNRVTGNDASAIYGRINANGQVYLVNPSGILFGRDARVDVGGLLASTANISNADFMAGRLHFNQPGKPGATVQNLGTITVAEGGLAVLVGRGVANSGIINARLGKVALAAGDAFTLDLYGDRLVNLIIDPAAMAGLADARGTPLAAYVDHAGTINAEGGIVQLSASTVKSLVDNIINVSGVVRATSVDTRAGLISLRGDANTRLTLSGALDATGTVGGRIEATAGQVQLTATASADASGEMGSGSIAIGGDWQGRGALANAGSTSVARGARLKASATRAGDGGVIAVWSDGDTRFEGAVEARGGASSGKGGQVEVSGRQRLAFDGDVDTSAARGAAGALLLDPGSLIVSGAGGDDSVPAPGAAGDFTIKAVAINRQLVRGTNVLLQADQDITVNADASIDGRAIAGGTPGGGLAFNAGRNVRVDGNVILNNGNFSTSAGGTFSQGSASVIATGNGAIEIAGTSGISASNLLTTGKVALNSSAGAVKVDKAIAGGAVQAVASLDVRGRDGVNLAQGALVAGPTALASSAGAVALGGTLASGGAVSLDGNAGVQAGAIVSPAAVAISSAKGDVVLTGAVSGDYGEVNATTARAGGLFINTDGKVSLAGAAVGAGGLTIGGMVPETRAGAAAFGMRSVFSSGAVRIATKGDISLSGAGLRSGSGLDLDAGQGAVLTGAGKVEAEGSLRITAGSAVAIGSGGLALAGGGGMSISAGAGLTLDGRLDGAGGAVLLGAGNALSANKDIAAASLIASAGGRFTQQADSVISAGLIDVRGAAGIDASNLQTTGKLVLTSTGGAIRVAQSLSGPGSESLASLDANGRDGVVLAGGARVSGTTTLGSTAGSVDVRGGTLESIGGVNLNAYSDVSTAAIATGGDVLLSSAEGAVTLKGAVSGATGTVDGATRAASLVIRSKGKVSVDGAALAAGGLLIEGGGPVNFGAASVISVGKVTVVAAGDITTGAGGVNGDNGIGFASSFGAVTTGNGLLDSSGDISLKGQSGLTVGGDGLREGGARAGGNLTLIAGAGNLLATGLLQTAGGTIYAEAPDANLLTLNQVITWQQNVANSGTLWVKGGQVVLNKPLGSLTTKQLDETPLPAVTGYTTVLKRYDPNNRPPVGTVIIDAARDVELNGLNLDGLSVGSDNSPSNANPGLKVIAGNRIVSNGLIAVNKGNIILLAKGTGPTDGIYLGNSVYSRGLDLGSVKTGYDVTVGGVGAPNTRSAIYLFDNTVDKAYLPGNREIAKIVIANNVENYTDASTLVPATNASLPLVTVGADRLLALKVAAGPLHLGSMPQVGDITSDLGAAPITLAPGATVTRAPAGIGLKVQAFNVGGANGDKETVVSEVRSSFDRCGASLTYGGCGITSVDGNFYGGGSPQNLPPPRQDVTLTTNVNNGGVIGFSIREGDEGRITGFVDLLSGLPKTPLVTTHVLAYEFQGPDSNGQWTRPNPGGTVGYSLRGRLVQVDSAASHTVTRVLFGPGELQSDQFIGAFDTGGLLNGTNVHVNFDNGLMGSGANSNPGLAQLGGFGTAPPGTVLSVTGNSAQPQGQFGGFPAGTAGAATGSAAQLPAVPAFPADPVVLVPPGDGGGPVDPPQVAGNTFAGRLLVEAPMEQEGYVAELLAELSLGRRPTAEADLGRGSASAGAAPNVFRKRYRVALNSNAAVCAPDDLASQGKARDGDDRSCPAGQ